ncbi:hypothetical protein SBRY_40009 [Actinacidiphila bryophytorum]|uniref:Uncharacterized protein n=1 Tax=Actinacidiphila bryophytorum TaxID=1436133 RepID=A0A9W4MG44_9ACTN|nr:hypothetical protein SBRY_40009 [Actinacidiphila bryophytorum]
MGHPLRQHQGRHQPAGKRGAHAGPAAPPAPGRPAAAGVRRLPAPVPRHRPAVPQRPPGTRVGVHRAAAVLGDRDGRRPVLRHRARRGVHRRALLARHDQHPGGRQRARAPAAGRHPRRRLLPRTLRPGRAVGAAPAGRQRRPGAQLVHRLPRLRPVERGLPGLGDLHRARHLRPADRVRPAAALRRRAAAAGTGERQVPRLAVPDARRDQRAAARLHRPQRPGRGRHLGPAGGVPAHLRPARGGRLPAAAAATGPPGEPLLPRDPAAHGPHRGLGQDQGARAHRRHDHGRDELLRPRARARPRLTRRCARPRPPRGSTRPAHRTVPDPSR